MPALDQVFAALSDETRRAILARLHKGEAALSDVAQPFDMSQTAVSNMSACFPMPDWSRFASAAGRVIAP